MGLEAPTEEGTGPVPRFAPSDTSKTGETLSEERGTIL